MDTLIDQDDNKQRIYALSSCGTYLLVIILACMLISGVIFDSEFF